MPRDQDHDPDRTQGVMPFGDHLDELRRRLVWALAMPLLLFIASRWNGMAETVPEQKLLPEYTFIK